MFIVITTGIDTGFELMPLQYVPDQGVPKRFPYMIRPVDKVYLGPSVPDRGVPILDRKQAVEGIITKANSQKPIFAHLTRRMD
jgi:hypothetical protein